MAAGEGFEPSHTESESAVLPLHNPATFVANRYYYSGFLSFVNRDFSKNRDNFASGRAGGGEGKKFTGIGRFSLTFQPDRL